MKNIKKDSVPSTIKINSEIRHKELMYMSSYMSMIIKKEQLAALKMTG
jgi:hypothetical protein